MGDWETVEIEKELLDKIERVEILDIRPEDTIAIFFNKNPTMAQIAQLEHAIREFLKCNAIFFGTDAEIKVLRPKQDDNTDITLCH